jgi:hypothetical protein
MRATTFVCLCCMCICNTHSMRAHAHTNIQTHTRISCAFRLNSHTPAHALSTGVVLRDGDTEVNTEINFADVDVACANISAHTAHITCCDDDGVCHRFPPGSSSAACYSQSNAVSFETAVVTCFLQGMRLCTTQAELQTCDGTGCGHDEKQIWTAPLGACGISGVCVHACTCACVKHAHGIT